ncbi:eukaryotic translation initiation factor 5A-2-like [Clavelina lepadiformis]|uniref:Eukaryotic translation initiation factor 5A n=1 Tax=Clavelina lepadiformis TaxID=159417 RepID=A0ABP0G2Q4_CLALP
MSEEDFGGGSSGAAETYPKQCSSLRKNEFVLLKGKPCKIVDMSTSKTGKHGHAKVHLVGLDIFDTKKYEDICPSTHNMSCPNVDRKEYQCIGIEEDYVTLMDEGGDTREDLKATPTQIGEIQAILDADDDCLVSVLKAMGKEQIMTVKKGSK